MIFFRNTRKRKRPSNHEVVVEVQRLLHAKVEHPYTRAADKFGLHRNQVMRIWEQRGRDDETTTL